MYFPHMGYLGKNYTVCDYVTSSITVTEYLTYPYKQGDLKLINGFYTFIDVRNIQVKVINEKIVDKAAQIKAKYKFFKTMDALQLATA